MRARLLVPASLLALIAAAVPHAQQPAAEPTQLPVRRVVLYKSGVGYFEHQGSVTGTSSVAIQFTSAQLNDVLKSLTALDLDNGQISSIGYNSIAPIEQRLEALRIPLGRQPDLLQFYNALRGARVEVRTGAVVVTGRILGIERKPARDAASAPTDVLTVISNNGAVRTIALGPTVTVRITEQDLRDDIGRYLSVVASGRDQDVRRMTLAAVGDGTRRLVVSYVSEVPIWKSTYRLVLPDDGVEQAVLQGWAIVDNTVGADWTSVQLSLVAGAPQSFVQRVSQPYYARRPEVPLPQAILLNPQTHQATLRTGALAENVVGTGDTAAVDALTARPAIRPAEGAGRGAGTGAGVNVSGGIPGGVPGGIVGALPAAPPPPRQADYARLAVAANAQELGDLFEYRLTQPVTIRSNQSALVPILNGKVMAQRVSLWNRTPGSGRPLRAVWLTNGTGLTLDGGTLSVVDAGAFAGEGLVEPLKPGEKRLISYGMDLAVLVDARLDESSGRYTRVVARDGVVIAEQEERNRWIYRVRNEDAASRTLIVEHPLREGWIPGTDPAPAERTTATARFALPVAAKGEATLRIMERRPGETRFTIDQIDDRLIASFGQRGVSVDDLRLVLQPVIDARTRLAEIERQVSDLSRQVTTIANDQERVRGNIQALGNSRQERALIERYTRELTAQEDRLDELQAQIARSSTERDMRRAELLQLMQKLTFEVIVK